MHFSFHLLPFMQFSVFIVLLSYPVSLLRSKTGETYYFKLPYFLLSFFYSQSSLFLHSTVRSFFSSPLLPDYTLLPLFIMSSLCPYIYSLWRNFISAFFSTTRDEEKRQVSEGVRTTQHLHDVSGKWGP